MANPDGGQLSQLTHYAGSYFGPKWSPDGKKIAYQTAAGSKYFFYTNGRIALVPAEGGTPEVVTAAFDEIYARRAESA